MTTPRLIATDLDGTLLRHDGSLSPRTRRALRDAARAGAEVVFVTARPPRHLDRLAAATGLTGTAVCSNGALVYDITSRTVRTSRALPVPAARKVSEALLAAVPGVGFAVETGYQVLYEPRYGLRMPGDAGAEVPVGSLAGLWLQDAPIAKLLAWSAELDADRLLAAAEQAADGEAQFTHSGGQNLVEVSAHGVTKAATLAALCAARGIAAAEVVAFGDMPNDLPVLEWAGTAYAVANAHVSVGAAVSRHTASNDDDGVAHVLERLYGRSTDPD